MKGLAGALLLPIALAVGSTGVAHADATPVVSNQASASGSPAGSQIYDSAMLGYGVNPTGSLTFRVWGPDNATCAGTPIFTTSTAVNGNGYYESSRFTTNAAGTYRWTVVYGGDANNDPSAPTACSDPAGDVIVAKRTPVMSTSNSWVSPSATSTAVLSSASGPSGPTGTMTYRVYGPDNPTCAGAPVFTTSRWVAGMGTYRSAPFTPVEGGTYQWVVSYSGDANNNARGSICSDPAGRFTAVESTPTVVTGVPSSVPRGGTITVDWDSIAAPSAYDWVALYRTGTADGGAVAAWRYTTGTADGSVSLKFPWGAVAGSYEVRLMANNSIQRLATSDPINLVW